MTIETHKPDELPAAQMARRDTPLSYQDIDDILEAIGRAEQDLSDYCQYGRPDIDYGEEAEDFKRETDALSERWATLRVRLATKQHEFPEGNPEGAHD